MITQRDELGGKFMHIEAGVYVSSKMNFHKEKICCGNALIEVK